MDGALRDHLGHLLALGMYICPSFALDNILTKFCAPIPMLPFSKQINVNLPFSNVNLPCWSLTITSLGVDHGCGKQIILFLVGAHQILENSHNVFLSIFLLPKHAVCSICSCWPEILSFWPSPFFSPGLSPPRLCLGVSYPTMNIILHGITYIKVWQTNFSIPI